jgi:hypothetical protein
VNTNAFLSQFAGHINFRYECFDRVIVRGYIRKFFNLGCVVTFLKALGFSKKTEGVMRVLTDRLNAHISKEAQKNNTPILWWPAVNGGTDGAKLAYVEKHYSRKHRGDKNHVFCIITDKEPVRTVASKEITTTSGKKVHRLYDCRKPVKQYYIYVYDSLLGGPCYLKISSYLPFQCEFYFNGHNVIKHQLDKAGCTYRMKENAFIEIGDEPTFRQAAELLQGNRVQARISYWMERFFRFDRGTYSTRSRHLRHEWYLAQVEISSNVIFKSSRFCTSLFERLIDKFARLGLPDSIARIFSRRPARSDSKSFWRLYDNNACIKHWFRGNSIKQYNKTGSFIRTEITINNPKSLGLQKPLVYLQSYFWFALDGIGRLLDCCADVDVSSLDQGQAERFTQPVTDPNGNTVTAPDLRKTRQVALLKELLKPKHSVHGFKTAALAKTLPQHFSNPAQIRYELRKLTTRGLVKKKKHKSFYQVTSLGWKWFWLQITSRAYFQNPLISKTFKNDLRQRATQPSIIEQAYDLIHHGLDLITRELAVIP